MMKTTGQIAYEHDLADRPHYHDGQPRKSWAQLGDIERWSWERPISDVPFVKGTRA